MCLCLWKMSCVYMDRVWNNNRKVYIVLHFISLRQFLYIFNLVSYLKTYNINSKICGVLWTVAHQAPLSMGFFRQEYWSGLPFFSSRESSWLRDRNSEIVSWIAGRFFICYFIGKRRVQMPVIQLTFKKSQNIW